MTQTVEAARRDAGSTAPGLHHNPPTQEAVMAIRKGSTSHEFGKTYCMFIKRLKVLGCVFCPACYAYVWAEHQHAGAAVVDLRKAA
jgi:hypothetical protein